MNKEGADGSAQCRHKFCKQAKPFGAGIYFMRNTRWHHRNRPHAIRNDCALADAAARTCNHLMGFTLRLVDMAFNTFPRCNVYEMVTEFSVRVFCGDKVFERDTFIDGMI